MSEADTDGHSDAHRGSFLDALSRPIAAAPMAGGPTTPALVSAAEAAGGIGFLAAGYQDTEAMAADIHSVRAAGTELFGVNLFITDHDDARRACTDAEIAAYRERLSVFASEASLAAPGDPAYTDNDYAAKLEHLVANPVPVVSFTFGTPGAHAIERLHGAGSQVAVMVTNQDDARTAATEGADVLIAQGKEAGGHQSTFSIAAGPGEHSTLDLLTEIGDSLPDVPVIAAGGVHSPAAVSDALDAGARAVLVGTMLLCCEEAGTSAPFRAGLRKHFAEPEDSATAFTRAVTGRPARAVSNALTRAGENAPAAYPYSNAMTKTLRSSAANLEPADGAQYTALWCGDSLGNSRPAVNDLAADYTVEDVFDALLSGE
ncbi:NAD(P)H-dependent flavin oxidoreductase [Dietzia sp.]|uniref:NAD(P)H-dependent flavin oxidoreductase n=1 Tax=Dietzia sp. TaxID=1871616 RepID=UPI002FD8BBBC